MDDFCEGSWACLAGSSALRQARGSLRGWSLFFGSMLEAIFFDLGAILGGLGRPKWRSKSIFEKLFGSFFSHAISASILDRFLEAPNPKNRAPTWTGAQFLQNRIFEKTLD